MSGTRENNDRVSGVYVVYAFSWYGEFEAEILGVYYNQASAVACRERNKEAYGVDDDDSFEDPSNEIQITYMLN